MNQIGNFEEWIRTEMLATADMLECAGTRVFNSFADPKTPFPYLIFNVIPLKDKTGQAGSTIQTVILCDVQIYTLPALMEGVDAAITAFKSRLEETRGILFKGTNIAIRHDKPINRMTRGAALDEKIIVRGSTYKAWLSGSCS
jgi:hypothetical protein